MFRNARIALAKRIGRALRIKPPQLGQKIGRGRSGGGVLTADLPAADVSTYKAMRKDPQIALAMAVKKAPIARAKWDVVCENARVKRLVQENLDRIWRRMTLRSLSALEFGFQAFEKVWTLRGGAYQIEDLVDIDPADVTMLADERTGAFGGFQVGETKVLVEKAFVFTHQKEWGNLYGRSEFESICDVWWWSMCAYDLVNRYYERKADPPIKARAPSGVQTDTQGNVTDNMQHMEELVETLKSNGVVTLPAEVLTEQGELAWDAEYMLDDQRGPMFLEYINHLDAKKLRGLFVPERTVTQDQATGSYGMAETHRTAFADTEDLIVAEYEEQVNAYVVRPLVQYNARRPVDCRVKIARMADDEREHLWGVIERILASAEAGNLTRLIDRKRLLDNADIPMVEDIDRILKEGEQS